MEKNNNWICVASELPEENENVQVTYIGVPDNVYYCDAFAYVKEGVWYWALNDEKCNVRIVAWKKNCEPYNWKDSLTLYERKNLKFEYHIFLEKGYRKVMETEETDIVSIVIEAKNRATADRAMMALLKGAPNVKEYDGVCIED